MKKIGGFKIEGDNEDVLNIKWENKKSISFLWMKCHDRYFPARELKNII